MRLAGFIPCYNCAPQIARLLEKFPVEILPRFEKIYIVDNASTDGSAAAAEIALEARGLSDKFEIIRNEHNLGLGGSFKLAFERARKNGFSHLAMIHGDDQSDPLDLGRLIDEARRHPSRAAILGSRFSAGARREGYPLRRLLGNIFFNRLISLFFDRPISDIGSGLNLYRVDCFDREFISSLPSHIAFDLRLLFFLQERKQEYGFLPIGWSTTDQTSTIREFKVGWLILKEIFNWKTPWLKLN